MNILIVSATQLEVKPLLDFLELKELGIGMNTSAKKIKSHTVHILITSVGMVNTAFMMGRYAHQDYDLVMNVGICGAFDRAFNLGQVVNVTEDVVSELGAEDGEDFLPFDSLGLSGEVTFFNTCASEFLHINSLKKVKGITVNTIHGNEFSIDKVKKLYHPDVESMEGAAFFAASSPSYKNVYQIRCISNYVEKRDKSKWQIPLAIKHLNEFLIGLLSTV